MSLGNGYHDQARILLNYKQIYNLRRAQNTKIC